jgi:hypothetical protein
MGPDVRARGPIEGPQPVGTDGPASAEIGAAGQLLASLRTRRSATCAECGASFEGTSRRRYCSPACAGRAWRRAQRSIALGASEADAEGIQRESARCLGCGRPLGSVSGTRRRYCSSACRQRAYRQRKQDSVATVATPRTAPPSPAWPRILAAYARTEQLAAAQHVQLGRAIEQLGALVEFAALQSRSEGGGGAGD